MTVIGMWIGTKYEMPPEGVYVPVVVETQTLNETLRTLYFASREKDEDGEYYWYGHAFGRELKNVVLWFSLPIIPPTAHTSSD